MARERLGHRRHGIRVEGYRVDPAVGEESSEVGLFAWDDIPWDRLAFPSVLWALRHWSEVRHLPDFVPFGNPPDDHGAR